MSKLKVTLRRDRPIRADLEVAARVAVIFGCVAMVVASGNVLFLPAGLATIVMGIAGFRPSGPTSMAR